MDEAEAPPLVRSSGGGVEGREDQVLQGAQLPPSSRSGPGCVQEQQKSPRRVTRTFAEVLASTSPKRPQGCVNALVQQIPISFDNLDQDSAAIQDPVRRRKPTTLNGKPCIYLSKEELDLLAKPLDLSLIGKFPAGRPKWVYLQRYFRDMKFLGSYKLSHLDSRHFVIHFSNQEDYIRVFSKTVTTIGVFTVKYLKWSMGFDVNVESSITPIWINMPLLSMSMFTQNMLHSIAEVYGKPLLIDYPTAIGVKPSIARVLVEMDLLAEHPEEVWMGNEEDGFFQKVKIERRPRFCAFCRKFGHLEFECLGKNPDLQKKEKQKFVRAEGEAFKADEGQDKGIGSEGETTKENAGQDKCIGSETSKRNEPGEGLHVSVPQLENEPAEGSGEEAPDAADGCEEGEIEGDQELLSPKDQEENTGKFVLGEESYDKEYWEELDHFKSRFWEDYMSAMEKERQEECAERIQVPQILEDSVSLALVVGESSLQVGTVVVAGKAEAVLSPKAIPILMDRSAEINEARYLRSQELEHKESKSQGLRQEEEAAVHAVDQLSLPTESSGETLEVNTEDRNTCCNKIISAKKIPQGPSSSGKDSIRFNKQIEMDMLCMGFDIRTSQDDEAIGIEDKLLPPHRKQRRKSMGD